MLSQFFFEAQPCCQVLKIAIYYIMAFFSVTFIHWSVGALKQAFVNYYFPRIINSYVILFSCKEGQIFDEN